VVISITLAVFSGVEKLAFVVIENANAWNDDNNSMLVINNFIKIYHLLNW
jgi:hypothetical protein